MRTTCLASLLLAAAVLTAAQTTAPMSGQWLSGFYSEPTPGVPHVEMKAGRLSGATAWISYDVTKLNSTGWAYLRLETNEAAPADAQAYTAGYLEGQQSQREMYDYWYNYARAEYGPAGPSSKLQAFMSQQLQWVRAGIASPPAGDDARYWHALSLLIRQFDGLVAGYNASASSGEEMSELLIYMLNSVGDLEDLNGVYHDSYAAGSSLTARRTAAKWNGVPADEAALFTDCSAFIRITPDLQQLLAGHTTWRDYYAMLRTYKQYRLAYARNVSMSSSPGFLHSKDDFYGVQGQFIVMETTNSIFNGSLYKLLTPGSAFSWQRVMIANYEAANGSDWTALFALHNSGTYNNQWMVIDARRFKRGHNDASDLLWIAEQIPGTVKSGDVSHVLQQQGYWGSYNIPYFPSIFNASGYPSMVAKQGKTWTYEHCPRANIFRRNASDVDSLAALQPLMRYNNWQHDPLALGKPLWGVAARADLTAPGWKSAAFGGVDGKVMSAASVLSTNDVNAVCGPTHNQQPVFSFDAWPKVTHIGVPQSFDFDWVPITGDW